MKFGFCQTEKTINRIIKNFASLLTANGMIYVLTAVFMILFGREKGPEPLGVFSIVFIVATILRTINESGFEFSLPRDISKGDYSGIVKAQQIKNLVWFIILLPSTFVMYYTSDDIFAIILLGYNYFFTQSSTLKSVLKGTKKMQAIPKIEAFWTLILTSANILNLYFFYDLTLIYIFYVFAEMFKWIHFYTYVKNQVPFDLKIKSLLKISKFSFFKSNFKSPLNLITMNFLSSTQYRMPLLALGWFSTQAAVGIYSGAYRFITILKLIPGAILEALLPEFTVANNAKKLISSLLYSTLLSFAVFIPIYYFAEEIIILLLTDKFAASVPILKMLSFMFIPMTINLIFESFLLSLHKEKIINITLFISAIFILVFSFFSIREFSINFVALCAIIGELISLAIYTFVVLKIFRDSIGRRV